MLNSVPIYVFCCPVHGEFDVQYHFSEMLPDSVPCPTKTYDGIVDGGCCPAEDKFCEKQSKHVIKPCAIIFEGGTGAGRGRR